jgi:hypothetical protein
LYCFIQNRLRIVSWHGNAKSILRRLRGKGGSAEFGLAVHGCV